jgi:hypothetical protein
LAQSKNPSSAYAQTVLARTQREHVISRKLSDKNTLANSGKQTMAFLQGSMVDGMNWTHNRCMKVLLFNPVKTFTGHVHHLPKGRIIQEQHQTG